MGGAPPQRLTMGAVQKSQTTSRLQRSARCTAPMVAPYQECLCTKAIASRVPPAHDLDLRHEASADPIADVDGESLLPISPEQ